MKPITRRFLIPALLLAGTTTFAQRSVPAGEGTSWSSTWDDDRSFIENKGQFYVRESFGNDTRVLYGYDASFCRIFFKKQGVAFNFTQKTKNEEAGEADREKEKFRSAEKFIEHEKEEKRAVLKLDEVSYYWDQANASPEILASDKTSQYYNYSFYAGGVEKSEYYIPSYRKLLYRNLYPNIDVEYTIHEQSGIKYAIIVHPGADIGQVKMVYSGKIRLLDNGSIAISTKFGDIIDHAPLTFYQDAPQQTIASRFIKNGKTVSFELGDYDKSKTVVIDPWTDSPTLTNSNKIWETETSSTGDAFIYGGDSFIKLRKYNSTGTLQWTYTSPWDSANYWIGGFITHPNGESYMTSGSNGEIRKISTTGTVTWSNNPNGLTSYEYWSLAFNCDLTKLVVGGTRVQFGFPTPTIRGVIININLASGAQAGITVVGYGASTAIPPSIQEVSSICYGPNSNFYFLTLDTIGSINNALSTINFKVPTSYAFDYYIPGYGFGTKQPISAIRANANGVYTINGSTVHKRSLTTGAVVATAAIPSGSYTGTFLGRNVNGNGGIDIDANGFVYVGTTNGVVKYDANLVQQSITATPFAVYDVDVNSNGEVLACGWSGGTGYVRSLAMSAGAQITYSCSVTSPLSATSVQTNPLCYGACTGTATVTASGGTAPYTYAWAPSGGNAASAGSLCAGTYTCTITDATSATTTVSVTITQPSQITASASSTGSTCGNSNGSATVTASGGTGTLSYAWAPAGGNAATANNLAQGSYTCTITDANNCSIQQVVNISGTTAPTASLQSTANISCNGGSNGSATVSASGSGPFTYAWAPSGGNAATASNLGAGTYTCTITDANGCTVTQQATITQPAAISASSGSTPATCGGNNGSATVTASGGTGTLSYTWAPSGGNAATASNLAAGTYTCTITDANNCSAQQIVVVSNTGGPTVSLQSSGDVSCFGGNNGTATVSATGNGPFTYAWLPGGGNNATAASLIAGTYTVTVTDQNSCTSTQIVTITEPPQITSGSSSTPATCGNSDGSATVTASGGTGSFTYAWAPSGGNAATANNIAAGTYTCTITDGNSCAVTEIVVVSNTGGPTVSVQSSGDVSCFGGTNGTATIAASGNGPFTYAWLPSGGNAATASNLSAGSYTVTVTDAGNCSSTQVVSITEPPQITAAASSTPASCGNNNGSATVSASGGTGTLSYAWSPSGGNAATATNLAAGTYTCTITDANGCSVTASTIVSNSGAPVVTVQSSGNVSCNGGSDGTATVSVSGGSSPYTYAWSPSGGNAATANSLTAGTYTITVTGSDGCTQTQTVTITQPAAISVSTTSSPENCGAADGSATATASGGTGTFIYAWAPSGGSNATANNLSAGSYTCTVTDLNGCIQTTVVVVSGSGSAVANAGTSVTIQQGQTTVLSGSGGGTYSWSPPTGLSCTNCANPVASPSVTTTYTLTVTDSLGCTASDTVTVYVDIACGELYLPNAFSPNHDGQNDVLFVRGNCIQFLQFEIYNRWGERVFQTSDPAHGWDGTWRGKDCESEVFTYVLRATLLNGTEVEKQGNISLVK